MISKLLSDKSIIPPTVADRKKMVPFVGCLKKKSNFFLTKMMDENRLYQYAYPKLPCAFVGKWHVSENMNEYWLTINADSTFFIKAIRYGQDEKSASRPLRTGVWSSTSPNIAIQFFDDSFFWPINQSSVEWVSKNYFLMNNGFDQTLYFNRHRASARLRA